MCHTPDRDTVRVCEHAEHGTQFQVEGALWYDSGALTRAMDVVPHGP